MGLVVCAAELLQPGIGSQLRLPIIPHAAFIVEHDVRNASQRLLDLEQFVDLLLVLDHGEVDLGIFQYVSHVGRRRILIQGHRHAAQALRRRHRPVQARPVVADHRQVHAAPEAEGGQATGKRAHLIVDGGPARGLPDAQVLFAEGRMIRARLRMLQQQARESQRYAAGCLLHHRPTLSHGGRSNGSPAIQNGYILRRPATCRMQAMPHYPLTMPSVFL